MTLCCLKDVGERVGRENIPWGLYEASVRFNSRLGSWPLLPPAIAVEIGLSLWHNQAKCDRQCMQDPLTERMDGKEWCWPKLDVMLWAQILRRWMSDVLMIWKAWSCLTQEDIGDWRSGLGPDHAGSCGYFKSFIFNPKCIWKSQESTRWSPWKW